jgi:hypothetical protein
MPVTATPAFEPGTRVEVEDDGRYQPATVVRAEMRPARPGSDDDRARLGYRVRYDNGCETWVREWRVREYRVTADEHCTHGADCRVHPDVNGLHNFDAPTPPGPYAEVAAELHRIADALAAITGDQPALKARFTLYVPWHLRMCKDRNAHTAELVDPVARALTGQSGTAEQSGAGWHHQVQDERGPIHVWVYGPIDDPTAADRDAELERLRRVNAELLDRVAAATAAAALTPDAVIA